MTIQEVLASAPGTEFDIEVTEQQLNELAGSAVGAQVGLPLEQPKVSLQPGEVLVEATTRFSGIPLKVSLTGAPAIEEGTLRFDVHQVLLNGAAAPAFVQGQVAQALNDRLRGDAFPVELDHLEVREGTAMVKGRRR